MIRGYITGIAIHTFSNQVRYILGYNVPENHRTEAFKLFYVSHSNFYINILKTLQ